MAVLRRSLSFALAALLTLSNFAAPARRASAQSAAPAPQADAPLEAKLAAVERAVEEGRKRLGIPGLSLVIVKDDRVVYMKGLGLRDFERKLPVTPDTLFAIGSSSKAFTSMLVAMAADEGKISLEDSPRKFLPYFKLQDPEADAKITVRDLLSHASGLNRTDLAWITGVLSREEVIRVAAQAKPTAKLREKWQYQNVMYSAAGECVARAEGSTWEGLIRERIFKPLGMRASNLSVSDTLSMPDYSLGYVYDEDTKETRRQPMRDFPQVAAAGAINSNARDMAQWLRLMLGGGAFEGRRLVSEANFAELLKPQMKVVGNVHYGLGWMLRDWRGHKVAEHGGNIDGFNAQVALMPDQRLGFVLLTNVSASTLPAAAMEAVWSNLVGGDAPKADTAAAPVRIEDEAGSYFLEEAKVTMDVAVREGKLTLSVPGQPTYTLAPAGGRRYKFAEAEGFFVTFRPSKEDPKETELYIEQPQGNYALKRVKRTDAANAPAAGGAAGTKPSITVDELMRKAVEALGGEAAIRRHKSFRAVVDVDFEHQGVKGEGVVYAKAPNASAQEVTITALGKKLGSLHDFFDGAQGGEEATFFPFQPATGKELDDARVASAFYPQLEWKSIFKTAEVKRVAKVDDEDAYVVVFTPEKGNAVTSYYSTKTFLLLRQDTLATVGPVTMPVTERLSDYRPVDGVMVAHRRISSSVAMGDTVMKVREVKFDAAVPEEVFRRKMAK